MVLEENTTTPDGALQPARTALANAISNLIDPRLYPTDQGDQWLNPRYHDLREALTAQRIGSRSEPQSQPPAWLGAIELLSRIDHAVHGWEPNWPINDCDEYPTVQRLRQLDARKWRPQDTDLVQTITNDIIVFIAKIDHLLEPPRIIYLDNACPLCAKTETYRKPEAVGEPAVRVTALQITHDDTEIHATCNSCHALWPKENLGLLGRLLGNRIQGVIET